MLRVRQEQLESQFSITCKEFRPLVKNTLQGFATLIVTPPGLTLVGCSVHDKNGKKWIGLPAQSYEKNGTKQWSRIVDFAEKADYFRFQALALKAITAFRSGQE